jgi:hypothetical protein
VIAGGSPGERALRRCAPICDVFVIVMSVGRHAAAPARFGCESQHAAICGGENRKTPDQPGRIGADQSQSKTASKNKSLLKCLNHTCVLFVQHPSKNARSAALPSGSFIACARSFGNCDDATEGGIPKSSRLGRSLKSLAFMRVCPKARATERRVDRDKGTNPKGV